jgi:glucoamylase
MSIGMRGTRTRSRALWLRSAVLITALSACLGAGGLASAGASSAGTAPGAPGGESYFDLARKDCVGTARNDTSKVWFTVAHGMLSDTYWPTVDATNVGTLQYIVSDGHSFADLQARDMTYTSRADASGMACTVIARNAAHGYRITTTYIADAARDAVLMQTRFEGPSDDQLYVRLDPLAGGTGGGGPQNAGGNSARLVTVGGRPVLQAFNTNTTTNAANRDYAVPTFETLEASRGFASASVGYAKTRSDGVTMLDSQHALSTYTSAPNGHVALTARVRLAGGQPVRLALGFGTSDDRSLAVTAASLRQSFASARRSYLSGWRRFDRGLRHPSGLGATITRHYYQSINVVRASEDKTFPGAIAAGLASPWGQSVPADQLTNGQPTYFGSYREVFSRDLYEAFTALLLAGDVHSAQAADRFLFERQQQPDGSMPRNSLENGKPAPDTGGTQLDETAYPILMDWESGLSHDTALFRDHVIPAADFLVAHGPSLGSERWEEQSGYSPSTISAEIAGLTAASAIARTQGDAVHAAVYRAVADDFARNIKAWTVTTTGSLGARYFLRLSKTGDPNAAISYNLGNGSITADQREVIDAGFQELVRLGILPASDSDVQASLAIVDRTIKRSTPNGVGFYRYGTPKPGSEDGYGDCYVPDATNCSPTGAPWPPTDRGSGHLWPVLAGERGEYELAAGNAASAQTLLSAMAAQTSGGYLEPEQAWEDPALAPSPYGTNPATASIGFAPGEPAGSASPLSWAQAQYARLALSLSAGHNLDTPTITTERYVTRGMPGTLPLTVTSPANGSSVSTPTITVTGTTAPGASVSVEAVGAIGGAASVASAIADGSGNWSVTVPASFGSTTITVTAAQGPSTAYSQLAVTDVALPGTPVFGPTGVSDPAGDDNGPGTYAYPTDPSFHPGAFDLTNLQVSYDATNVYVQVTLADLSPTFGSPFGAQLLDVFVRNPAVSSTSTAAPFPSRNYTIAPGSAWSERIEAQGFAPVSWVDASGSSLGSAQLVADQASRTATLILPRSAFGTPSSGWTFTLALTGQDGFSPDQARSFAPTPQPFQFGVCPAPGDPRPICSVNPASVPKVIDTITPAGVSQATELDPTLGPVMLQGVTVP